MVIGIASLQLRAGESALPRVDDVTHVLHPTDAVDHIIISIDASSHAVGGWQSR